MTTQTHVPSIVSQDASGTVTWDDLPAPADSTVTLDNGFNSDSTTAFFEVTAGTFSIPANATILGITIQFLGFQFNYLAGSNTDDSAATIQVCRNSALVGTHSDAISFVVGSVARTLGGSSNLLGTTWTPAQINGRWGVGINALNQTSDGLVQIIPQGLAINFIVDYSTPVGGYVIQQQKQRRQKSGLTLQKAIDSVSS